ncbi:MAG: Smr/MutS family protein [Balneolales bacterium]
MLQLIKTSFIDTCMNDYDEPEQFPIDGTLDLHIFKPNEVKSLVPEYLEACREKGIYNIRIIHGKGTGALRRMVHTVLDRLEYVEEYHLAGPGSGSWGATQVQIRQK